ncbi:MAG TPA: glycosyltransferase [Hyphomicrobiaceae bacterium]|nr:glycosyltransferase [Hyphomicrobiaceae bacterium]
MANPVSVVVEWENAKLSDLERAERMLAELGRQMAEAARKRGISAELMVLYDSDAIDAAVPRTAVTSQIDAAAWPGTIRVVAAPGRRYYEQKNKGAQLASGDILLFLDSDVIPDAGWLEAMLAALDDPAVAIVGGEAYHATDTFYDKLFAAFWEFPTRRARRGVYRANTFYANNLAVRRAFALAHPFPESDSFRGQCSQLAKSLRAEGIAIYRQGDAAVSHPPPEGARTFLARALCRGHDTIFWRRRRHLGVLLHANPIASLVRWARELLQVLVKVTTRARTVGLGPLGALAAIAVGFVYYSCKLAGEVVSFFAPGLIRNNFSV